MKENAVMSSLNYFKKYVLESEKLKMSFQDLERLYQTNVITEKEERAFETNALEKLVSPAELCRGNEDSEKSDSMKLEEISKYLKLFQLDRWMNAAAVEKETGRYHKLYTALDHLLRIQKGFLDEYGDEKIEIDGDLSFEDIKSAFPEIHQAFNKKGKVSKAKLLFDPTIRMCLKGIYINDHQIQSEEDCVIVKAYVTCRLAENHAEKLWNTLLVPYDIPEFESISDQIIYQTSDLLQLAFEFPKQMERLKEILRRVEIDWKQFLCINRYDTKLVELEKAVDGIETIHNLHVALAEEEKIFRNEVLQKAEAAARSLIEYMPVLGGRLYESLRNNDYENYQAHFEEVYALLERKETIYARRKVLLRRLAAEAPELANAIAKREEPHSAEQVPAEIREAFEAKMMSEK